MVGPRHGAPRGVVLCPASDPPPQVYSNCFHTAVVGGMRSCSFPVPVVKHLIREQRLLWEAQRWWQSHDAVKQQLLPGSVPLKRSLKNSQAQTKNCSFRLVHTRGRSPQSAFLMLSPVILIEMLGLLLTLNGSVLQTQAWPCPHVWHFTHGQGLLCS